MDIRRPIVHKENWLEMKVVFFKAFWKMIFATKDGKEVDEFLITYFMMVTNLNYYFTDSEEFIKDLRVLIEGQFEHALYDESFSNQFESDDEIDTLQQRIKWWMVVVDRLGVIPNDVYDYTFDELYMLYRKARDPEMQILKCKFC